MTIDPKLSSLGLVLCTVMLTVGAQLIVKWRVVRAGAMPPAILEKVIFLMRLLLDPWIIASTTAAFVAGLFWLAAMTKLELSYAYPFLSLAFVLVLILSTFLFHESLTTPKVLGMALVVVGLIIASQG